MFQCDRVKDDLVIRVGYKPFMAFSVSVIVGLICFSWAFWFFSIKVEMARVRKGIYSSVSQSLGDVIKSSFTMGNEAIIRLRDCQSEMISIKAVNTDLAKIVSRGNGKVVN